MPTITDAVSQGVQSYRLDEAAKRGLLGRLSCTGFAMDATEVMSAKELAIAVLKKLKLEATSDPVSALSYWLDGHERARSEAAGGPSAAMDAEPSSMDTFFDKYLRGE